MKTFCIHGVLLLLLVSLTIPLSAQNPVSLSGLIYDAANDQPLPYVNITLPGQSIGTVSNSDGYFLFRCPAEFLDDTLMISHIGYRSDSRPARHFQNGPHIIELQPEPVALPEVVVSPVTGLDIVKAALERIPENYPPEPYLMTGFYRELIREKQDLHKYAEGVIRIYREPEEKDRIKLIKGRKRENLPAFAVHKKADPTLGGPMHCFYRDISHYHREFFSAKFFRYYDYTIEGITRVNGKATYIIAFDKKPSAKKGWYRGQLYIERNSKAIIKAEYEYNEFGLKKSQPDAVQRSLAKLIVGITFESGGSQAEVLYTEIDGRWYLKNVRYSIVDKLTRKDTVYLYTTEKELLISGISTRNVHDFAEEELLDPAREFADQLGEYDEEFWQEFNIISATDSQKALIDEMGTAPAE